MFEYTGVDGIMIGRASIGNPYIFKEIKEYLQGKKSQEITKEEKLATMLKHINLAVETKGEDIGIKEMRKHLSAYIKGLPKSAEAREKINKIENRDEVEKYIKEYFEKL